MGRTINYKFNFWTGGMGNLLNARHVIQSFGGTSWSAFNAASRGADHASRSFKGILGLVGGLGAGLGFGLLAKTLMSSNSELQVNTIILRSMMRDNKEQAEQTITMFRNNAAEMGYQEAEVFKAGRGILEAFSGRGRKVDTTDLEKLTQMSETLNSMDTENRGLAYNAFAIKELGRGIGKIDWKSMHARNAINLGTAMEDQITKAFKGGKMKEGIAMLEKGLRESRVYGDMNDLLMKGSLALNLNAIRAYASRVGMEMGKPLFEALTHFAYGVKMAIKPLMNPDTPFMKGITAAGDRMRDRIVPVALKILKTFLMWGTSLNGSIFIDRFIEAIQTGRSVILQLAENWLGFIKVLDLGNPERQAKIWNLLIGTLRDLLQVAKAMQPILGVYAQFLKIMIDFSAEHPRLFEMYVLFKLMGGATLIGGLFKLAGGLAAVSAAGTAGSGIGLAAKILGFTRLLSSPIGMTVGSTFGTQFLIAARTALLTLAGSTAVMITAATALGIVFGQYVIKPFLETYFPEMMSKVQAWQNDTGAWFANTFGKYLGMDTGHSGGAGGVNYTEEQKNAMEAKQKGIPMRFHMQQVWDKMQTIEKLSPGYLAGANDAVADRNNEQRLKSIKGVGKGIAHGYRATQNWAGDKAEKFDQWATGTTPNPSTTPGRHGKAAMIAGPTTIDTSKGKGQHVTYAPIVTITVNESKDGKDVAGKIQDKIMGGLHDFTRLVQ